MKKITGALPLLLMLIGICMDVNAWPDNLFNDFAMEENQQDKQAFSFNDIYKTKGVSGVELSPDGKSLLCVVTTTDTLQNSYKDSVVIINIATKQKKFLTEGSSPCLSPDGSKFVYISADGELWKYNLQKNQKKFLAKIFSSNYFINHMAEMNFAWSPDGKQVAYISTFPHQDSNIENEEVKVIDRLMYKTKGGRGRPFFADDLLTSIFVVSTSGGEPEAITDDKYNESSLSWSSDSRSIVFISNRSGDPDNNVAEDLWRVNIETKKVTRLTENFGTVFQPACSPHGETVAFLATTGINTTNKDSYSEDTHLYVMTIGGGVPKCLTEKLDRRVENISWCNNGEFIYFTAGSEGKTPLYRISHTAGQIETIIDGNMHVLDYSLSNDESDIAYIRTDITSPGEVFHFQGKNKSNEQITDLNTELENKFRFMDAEAFWFKSFDGTNIQGWLMKPVSFDPSQKYPLILVIHGGPHNMFGYDFEDRMQLLASAGFGVVYMNPRGSHGYGQKFSSGTVLNWGGGDYKDLMAGMDYIIENYSWIDKKELGVTGQSYGGYMTNWIITQTNRFKAAVVDGGISNLISFAGTSLYHSLIETEFNGSAYDNFSLLWQWSPLRDAKNVTTPTLFLHGRKDNEVPVSQAEEMYVALKKCNVNTSFVQYMNEGHGWRPDLKPENRNDLFRRMIGWFNQHLKSF